MPVVPLIAAVVGRSDGNGEPMKYLRFLLLLPLLAPGCVSHAVHNGKLAAIRPASSTIATEHLEWSASLAQQPGAKPLPNLAGGTQAQRDAWYRAKAARKAELDTALQP